MTGQDLAYLAGLLLGGGALHLLDRWLYRRKPQLDIVALAQQIAERALSQAHAELTDAYQDAARARRQAARARRQAAEAYAEASGLQVQLVAARVEIERLVALLRSVGVHP